MCKISCRIKTAWKNKSSKIFDYLVRVHNDERLELCEREGILAKYTTVTSRRKLQAVRQHIVRYQRAYETSLWAGK